ncbi:type I restriction enzyme HsdR N-terminal domain-containing protein [Tsuneonella flava]|uniref:Type I restriction enzyme HsdR N-terminal domain-containing protein n=1 Tax=Tsuneonella flava TaxID=2055955 RepID=A0ABX7KCN3_9SPHN|nr:type I restriction endonuclease [Tsuneonella flava]QSB45573.1 type I restriction enzyme HsdR N-terminal domain-containing protein [Tsuneonella flava]
MELETKIAELSKTARDHREVLATEEAAKNALVMPFLQALGYNVFNPGEVIPEFTCDVGTKKGEKVDYAICAGDSITMLVECKPSGVDLNLKHASQLFRYFSTTEARVAVLTNGVVYKFFSDIDSPNRMDEKPFFTLDLDNVKKTDHRILQSFTKNTFDIDKIITEAGKLKLQSLVYKELTKELSEPSEEFVRMIASRVQPGRITASVKETFEGLIVASASALVRDRVNDRLTSALQGNGEEDPEPASSDDCEIVTTAEEIEGFNIIRAIGARKVDPARIGMRDAKYYCAVLLDDNNRKTIARLHFNSATARYIGTFSGKGETRNAVSEPLDIYKFEEAILDRLTELND